MGSISLNVLFAQRSIWLASRKSACPDLCKIIVHENDHAKLNWPLPVEADKYYEGGQIGESKTATSYPTCAST